jgi:hypothetical protein
MRPLFEKLRILERIEPEDPDRNFYALSELVDEVFVNGLSDLETLLMILRSLDGLLGELIGDQKDDYQPEFVVPPSWTGDTARVGSIVMGECGIAQRL